jgi:hypothetical protein
VDGIQVSEGDTLGRLAVVDGKDSVLHGFLRERGEKLARGESPAPVQNLRVRVASSA